MQGRVSDVELFVAVHPLQRAPTSASDFNSCPSAQQAWSDVIWAPGLSED